VKNNTEPNGIRACKRRPTRPNQWYCKKKSMKLPRSESRRSHWRRPAVSVPVNRWHQIEPDHLYRGVNFAPLSRLTLSIPTMSHTANEQLPLAAGGKDNVNHFRVPKNRRMTLEISG